uniref:Lipoyl synthase n=1 Tax=Magnetococcus massalia (strain MO-1) TaxID=451514 RepID=A0A1S7LMS5_MAGMO|nr:Lipoyl synthase (Lipoic acid synthase) (Lipoate synthase) (Lipoyl-acyl-carrier protein synthase) (Sulfur insertion protein lipA) (Lip-syn) [Candidatus Magnetococcus massalia]
MAHPLAGKPRWLKVKAPTSPAFLKLRGVLKQRNLNTVCEEANCPNMGQCWHEGTATFMILGDRCTRRCGFCNVSTAKPLPPDPQEPARIAEAAQVMGLKHAVVTSVDRDDLADGGAGQFVATIEALRQQLPDVTVEVLTPDFLAKQGALEQVVAAAPAVFNHNLETISRLYSTVRPVSSYEHSLQLLESVKAIAPKQLTKSGIMLGLGEREEEVLALFGDLRRVGVDYLTVGQYLRPTVEHLPVERYWTPAAFEQLGEQARAMGFKRVAAHPLARSSFHAQQLHHG